MIQRDPPFAHSLILDQLRQRLFRRQPFRIAAGKLHGALLDSAESFAPSAICGWRGRP